MITRLLLCIALIAIPGCSFLQSVVKKEVVTVAKPVPYCPAPPELIATNYLVDTLTDADAKDPGKVGQYYKHDMEQLRGVNKIYSIIIEQYRTAHGNLESVQKEIDEIFKTLDVTEKSKVEPLITK
jgi:hypothetical protein